MQATNPTFLTQMMATIASLDAKPMDANTFQAVTTRPTNLDATQSNRYRRYIETGA